MSNNKKNSNYYKSIWDRYQRMLMLSSFPVAVRMIQDVSMLDYIRDKKGRPIRRIDHKLTICQFLGQARHWNVTLAGTSEMLSICISGGAIWDSGVCLRTTLMDTLGAISLLRNLLGKQWQLAHVLSRANTPA